MPQTASTSRAAGHSGTILAFLLLLLIGQNLIYPQLAYPLHGLCTNAVLAVLFVLAMAFGGVRGAQATPVALGAILFFLVMLYVTGRNIAGHPSWFMGAAFPSTLILGFWVFLVAVMAARNDALAFPPIDAAADPDPHRSSHISVPRIVVALLAVFGLLMCLYAFYQYFQGFAESREMIEQGEVLFSSDEIRIGVEHALSERRVTGTFGNPNLFGAFISLIFPCGLMLALECRRWITRMAGLIVVASVAAALFLSGSRGGMLSVMFSGCVFLVLYFGARRLRIKPDKSSPASAMGVWILALALPLAAPLLMSAMGPPSSPPMEPEREYKQNFTQRLFITTTVKQRLYYWDIGWNIFKESPIIGRGAGMYALLYPQHRPPEARETRYAHNFAVQMAAEDGLAGLTLYLIWAGAVGVAALRSLRRCAHARTRAALAALLTVFLAFHFNSLFEYTFYYRGMFIIMATAAGVLWGYRWESPASPPPGSLPGKWRNHLVIWLTAGASLILAAVWIPRPMLVDYYLDWGDLFWSDRNFSEAAHYFHRAEAIAPSHPDVHLRLALEARQEGKWSTEREYLERAVRIGNPLSANLRSHLAEWHLRHGQPENALARVAEALELYPNNPRLHYQQAVVLKELGRPREARAAYRRAVDLGSNDPMFQLFLKDSKEF